MICFSVQLVPKRFSFKEELSEMWSKMCIGLHVSTRCSCQILMKLELYVQIFEKYSNTKLHENPSSGSRVFNVDGRTDMTKLLVTFRSFSNAPEKLKMWSCAFLKYSSVVAPASLSRNGYNAITNLANAVCITRTSSYACWLFLATSVKTLRPISSISWIIFITQVSKTRSLAWMPLSRSVAF